MKIEDCTGYIVDVKRSVGDGYCAGYIADVKKQSNGVISKDKLTWD